MRGVLYMRHQHDRAQRVHEDVDDLEPLRRACAHACPPLHHVARRHDVICSDDPSGSLCGSDRQRARAFWRAPSICSNARARKWYGTGSPSFHVADVIGSYLESVKSTAPPSELADVDKAGCAGAGAADEAAGTAAHFFGSAGGGCTAVVRAYRGASSHASASASQECGTGCWRASAWAEWAAVAWARDKEAGGPWLSPERRAEQRRS
jgi:hypothetical protein